MERRSKILFMAKCCVSSRQRMSPVGSDQVYNWFRVENVFLDRLAEAWREGIIPGHGDLRGGSSLNATTL